MARRNVRVLSTLPLPLLEPLRRRFPEVEIVHLPEEGKLPPEASGEVLLTMTWGSPNLADVVARGVRWVHAFGTGIDRFPFEALGDRVLTCSRGASAVPISEWVLAVMLAAEKKLPETWIHEPEGWQLLSLGGLHGRTLGLVGIGGIGAAVATRALAFGMRVRALRRTDTPSPVPGVEVVTSKGDLLAGADHLVIAAPATATTRHWLDRDALGQVRPGLHVVNVARGALVDQEALREALDDGRVALASLDVAEPEPLPAGHWLYTHPRVRLSPHISWSMPGALDILLDSFIDNLRRYMADEPLIDRVDRELGY
jgi:phosphoglycerate dehydrogenase-like enzyme